MRGTSPAIWFLCALAWLAAGCEERPKANPFENPAAPKQPPPIQEPPKPEGPPEFVIYADGPKVGWATVPIEKADGPKKLREEIEANKQHVSGKQVALRVDRKAKVPWVSEMIAALAESGASAIELSTDTRTEYPGKVVFTPVSSVKSPPPCSVVAKVLAERRNAVWHLKGGTAVRSPKGLAGPDMAMTQENVTRAANACKESDFVFVGADEGVEWGLVYDLAASTQRLDGPKLSKVVLLPEAPVAGRPVAL